MKDYNEFIEGAIVRAHCMVAAKYGGASLKPITYEFSNRLTRCAGKAYYTQRHVKFSTSLSRQCWATFQNTVYHEIAHIHARAIWPKCKPHGVEWKSLMILFGHEPTRTHSLEIKSKPKSKPHTLHCKCGKHMVTTTIFERFLLGRRYFCRKCKAHLSRKTILKEFNRTDDKFKSQTLDEVEDEFEDHLDGYSNEY